MAVRTLDRSTRGARVSGWLSPCALALSALALAGCVPDEGPAMRPGEDCIACHTSGATGGTLPSGERAHQADPAWSVAGTVFGATTPNVGYEGAQVQVTDAAGWAFLLRTNEAGNFYSAESPTFPLHVCLTAQGSTRCMQTALTSGACNSCHSATGSQGASLVAP